MTAGPDDERTADLAARLDQVRDRIAVACRASGRAETEVTLIGVTKTFPADDVARLVRPDRDDQLVGLGHGATVDRGDDVARADARAVGGTVGRDWCRALRARRDLDALALVGLVERDADDRVRRVTRLDELLCGTACLVGRDREPEPDAPAHAADAAHQRALAASASARADIQTARLNLQHASVKAPIAGRIAATAPAKSPWAWRSTASATGTA